jgi:GH24 family phage-related lysozyme (muramidase)
MKKIIATIIACLIMCITVSAKTYTISNEGMEFIKQYEKCVLVAYADGGGWSIGYGHHGDDVYEGMTITKEQANELFKKDIKKFEKAVNRLIDNLPYEYEFSQGFIDGLFSFVYNCGEGGAKSSTFYERLLKCRVENGVMNKEDFLYTVAAIKESKISAPGHKKRRYDEHMLMLS